MRSFKEQDQQEECSLLLLNVSSRYIETPCEHPIPNDPFIHRGEKQPGEGKANDKETTSRIDIRVKWKAGEWGNRVKRA